MRPCVERTEAMREKKGRRRHATGLLLLALLVMLTLVTAKTLSDPTALRAAARELSTTPVGQATYSGAEQSQSTITLTAVADATTKSWQPNTNFGGETMLQVSYSSLQVPRAAFTLLRFDVSSIPTNAVIDSAVLELYLWNSSGADPVWVGVYDVYEGWDEYSVTWNTRPNAQTGGFVYGQYVDANPGYKSWAVSGFINAWRTGPNYGLELRGPIGGDPSYYERNFGSRDGGVNLPRLVVTYHVPTSTRVVIMVAATPDEAELLLHQTYQFEEQNPDIQIDLLIVPFADFNAALLARIAAGVPPDVAVLSYDHIAEFQDWGYLEPLDELVAAYQMDLNDFLPDALESNRFNGRLYGLPWLRSACLPRYRNLALFEASDHPGEAFRLMNFLTQRPQQRENYTELGWFPTRWSVYGELGLYCPPPTPVIRLAPEDVSRTRELVGVRSPNLWYVLEGQTINAYEATALIEGGEIRVAAAPVTDPISEEQFETNLCDGVISGGLFVNAYLSVLDSRGNVVGTIAPGDYVLKWRGCQVYLPLVLRSSAAIPDAIGGVYPEPSRGAHGPWNPPTHGMGNAQVKSYLVKPDGTKIEIKFERFEATDGPVGQPFCSAEGGSIRICWHIDGLRGCLRIG